MSPPNSPETPASSSELKSETPPELSADMISRMQKFNIGSIRRHILICGGPKCCTAELGEDVWTHLKSRLAGRDSVEASLYRTKVLCLRVCREGPVAVVYPEGTWYRLVSKEVCDRIVDEHLFGGVPVKEFIFSENPLNP